MHLTLIRHGESTWNATGRWQGQKDVPLSSRGQLQVRALSRKLYRHEFDVRVSSDLTRATETAKGVGGIFQTNAAFREINVGAWTGMLRKDVASQFPEEVKALQAGQEVKIGGGESMPEFERRIDQAVNELRQSCANSERAVVVCHGGVIRAMLSRIFRSRKRYTPVVGAMNTSITHIDYTDRPVLRMYNDGTHLDLGDQDSTVRAFPKPYTRLVLVASEAHAPNERRLADRVLNALELPHYYMPASQSDDFFANQLLADPVDGSVKEAIENLIQIHRDGAFAMVLRPETILRLLSELLHLPAEAIADIAPATHGSVTQIRYRHSGPALFCYAVPVSAG